MKTIPQYVTSDGRRYYYSTDDILCFSCRKKINDFVVVFFEWNKKKSEVFEYCLVCSRKHHQSGLLQEKFVMGLVDKKPVNSKLVLISPPDVVSNSKDSSLFSNTLESPKVKNRCRRAGHRDYTVLDDNAPAIIGLPVNESDDDKVFFLEKNESIKKLL